MSEAGANINSAERAFNPAFDSGHGTKVVVVEEKQIEIHDTNNLGELLGAYVYPITDKIYHGSYDHVFKKDEAVLSPLFKKLEDAEPELYMNLSERLSVRREARFLRGIDPSRMTDKHWEALRPSDEEMAEVDLMLSQAFDVMAPIIKTIDTTYEPQKLCL